MVSRAGRATRVPTRDRSDFEGRQPVPVSRVVTVVSNPDTWREPYRSTAARRRDSMCAVIALLHHLLAVPAPANSFESLESYWAAHRLSRWPSPFDGAVAGGFAADRIGFAFAAGYESALKYLLPSEGGESVTAFCITEEGGNHPRAIRTAITHRPDGSYVLSGRKRWSTLATRAVNLLVAGSVGSDESGRNRLRLARVPADAPGVRITFMPPTAFCPEIPHVEVELDGVVVPGKALLEGDGYEEYIKPFRTVEDLHLQGALLGYLLGVARRSAWPASVTERILALIVAARALAAEDLRAAEVHVALAGVLADAAALAAETAPLWQQVSAPERDRFERDRAIWQVAARAREARRERAWERLSEWKQQSGR
jgi:alkylation response protein AidB-like acyl-CoA dehydrogenase